MRRLRKPLAPALAVHVVAALFVPIGAGCASVLGDDYEIISARRSGPVLTSSGGGVTTGAGGSTACSASADAGPPSGSAACAAEATCADCSNCAGNGPCSAESDACVMSSNCLSASTCFNDCTSGDQTCLDGCLNQPGGDLLYAYLSCAACVCKTPCGFQ